MLSRPSSIAIVLALAFMPQPSPFRKSRVGRLRTTGPIVKRANKPKSGNVSVDGSHAVRLETTPSRRCSRDVEGMVLRA